MSTSVPSITAILVLDADGKRIAAKYYSREYIKNADKALALEKKLFTKTGRTTALNRSTETVMFDNILSVHSILGDCILYVLVNEQENELIALEVLNAIQDTLNRFLQNTSKRAILDQLDVLLLCIDETVDDGMILETDSQQLLQRVSLRGGGVDGQPGGSRGGFNDVPLSEQTFSQAFQTAREQLARSFR